MGHLVNIIAGIVDYEYKQKQIGKFVITYGELLRGYAGALNREIGSLDCEGCYFGWWFWNQTK